MKRLHKDDGAHLQRAIMRAAQAAQLLNTGVQNAQMPQKVAQELPPPRMGTLGRRMKQHATAGDPFAMIDKPAAISLDDSVPGSVPGFAIGVGSTPDEQILTPVQQAAVQAVAGAGSLFRPDFQAWLVRNWHIWSRFEQEADKVWDRGRRKYSARTIIEYIRHEIRLQSLHDADDYKINNSFVPDIGRLYGVLRPEREAFFECRVMRNPTIRTTIRCGKDARSTERLNKVKAQS